MPLVDPALLAWSDDLSMLFELRSSPSSGNALLFDVRRAASFSEKFYWIFKILGEFNDDTFPLSLGSYFLDMPVPACKS